MPTAKVVCAPNVPSPLPSSTDTLLLKRFAVTRSARPSPLTSAVVTAHGPLPTAKVVCAPNVPLPLPSSTDTVSLPLFAVMRSGWPSPLTSAVVTEIGSLADREGGLRAERAVAVAQQHRHRVAVACSP